MSAAHVLPSVRKLLLLVGGSVPWRAHDEPYATAPTATSAAFWKRMFRTLAVGKIAIIGRSKGTSAFALVTAKAAGPLSANLGHSELIRFPAVGVLESRGSTAVAYLLA